jgi:hypothetical protein
MDAHKLQVKLYATSHQGVDAEAFIPVFHAWIKNEVLPELLIDVANYGHVPQGPGVALIGHGSDYYMDEAQGRLGLLYSRKRAAPPAGTRVVDALRRALRAAILLEQEPAFDGKLRFGTGELLVRINDRLAAPNSDASFAAIRPELEKACATMFGDAPFELTRVGTARDLFGVKIVTQAKTDLATLLDRLGGPATADGSKPA